MKQNIFTLGFVFLGLFCISVPAAVIITEFMYDPSSGQVVGGTGDFNWEWVEIYNNGPFAEDLQGWELGDAGTTVLITSSSVEIQPYSYIILTEQSAANFNAEWNTSLVDGVSLIDVGGTGNIPSLNNDGDTIRLIDGPAPTGVEVFSITYSDDAPAGMSLGYFGNLSAGDAVFENDARWRPASLLSESFTADSGDLGSPGALNGSPIPEPSTVVLFLLGGLLINRRLKGRYI